MDTLTKLAKEENFHNDLSKWHTARWSLEPSWESHPKSSSVKRKEPSVPKMTKVVNAKAKFKGGNRPHQCYTV